MNPAQTPATDRWLDELARWSAGAILGVVTLVVALVAWRRLDGSLDPPPASTSVVVAILAAAAIAAARGLGRRGTRDTAAESGRRLRAIVAWGPVPLVVLLGGALCVGGALPAGVVAAWAILLGGEAAFLVGRRGRGLGVGSRRLGGRQFRADSPQTPAGHLLARHAPAAGPEAEPREECVQQLVRVRGADGSESVSGWLRVEVEPGQRTANAHVAFCPPLAHPPEVEVDQSAGPSARIKTAQRLPHGVRFDLKLAEPVEAPSTLLLRFLARSRPS